MEKRGLPFHYSHNSVERWSWILSFSFFFFFYLLTSSHFYLNRPYWHVITWWNVMSGQLGLCTFMFSFSAGKKRDHGIKIVSCWSVHMLCFLFYVCFLSLLVRSLSENQQTSQVAKQILSLLNFVESWLNMYKMYLPVGPQFLTQFCS